VRDLNQLYLKKPALHELDCEPTGFEWIDNDDDESSVVRLMRKDYSTANLPRALSDFTPVPRKGYRLGVPRGGFWCETLNSDAVDCDGNGVGNRGRLDAEPLAHYRRPFSFVLILPPMSVSFFVN